MRLTPIDQLDKLGLRFGCFHAPPMGKAGEIDYLKNFKNFGPDAVKVALEKPFSDPNCWRYFLELGALMALLPPPPARLLDLGCGTGWTSRFFAKRGYEVVGVDIAPDMITAAEEMKRRDSVNNLTFLVADYEDLDFKNEFEAAVFYDSLHHAVDEHLALQKTHQALRQGGVLLCSEPGEGHTLAKDTIDAVKKFDVTEKDMPPRHIIDIGQHLGFREFACFPSAWVNRVYTAENPMPLEANPSLRPNRLRRLINSACRRILNLPKDDFRILLNYARQVQRLASTPRVGGITRMVK